MASPEWIRLIWDVVTTAISFGAAIYVFFHMKQAANQSETNALRTDLTALQHSAVDTEQTDKLWEFAHEIDNRRSNTAGELKDRMKDLESNQAHMPTQREVQRVIVNQEAMKETMSALRNQVQTMDDYLRKPER
ncbi:hypothetical protein QMT40_002998 [Parvibaculaceae bacterium PLY_AMNH_Bact1]|nr:hypothetical protein QMT40_002998 [Parvibaculaceae bacterium PLY_AMNH_Bact1]